jgi:hypothetical protein
LRRRVGCGARRQRERDDQRSHDFGNHAVGMPRLLSSLGIKDLLCEL